MFVPNFHSLGPSLRARRRASLTHTMQPLPLLEWLEPQHSAIRPAAPSASSCQSSAKARDMSKLRPALALSHRDEVMCDGLGSSRAGNRDFHRFAPPVEGVGSNPLPAPDRSSSVSVFVLTWSFLRPGRSCTEV